MARAKKSAEKTAKVKVSAENVMLDEKTSLADADPAMAGETVTAEVPDLSDPAVQKEQAELKSAFSEQTEEAAKEDQEEPQEDEKDRRIQSLEEQVERLMEKLNGVQQPQVIQVAADTEKVTLRFQSECAQDNVATFGPGGLYGQITGQTGTLMVPKNEWSRFMTDQVRYLLKTRQLIVLSGMDEDERELYGVNYKEGELLDRKAFQKILDMGQDLVDIFPGLCRSHQEMVAKRFTEAFNNGDARAMDRDLLVKLNEITKEGGQKGMFTKLISMLNKQDEEEETE